MMTHDLPFPAGLIFSLLSDQMTSDLCTGMGKPFAGRCDNILWGGGSCFLYYHEVALAYNKRWEDGEAAKWKLPASHSANLTPGWLMTKRLLFGNN